MAPDHEIKWPPLLGAVFLYLYLAPVWTGALVHVYRHRWTPDGTPG